MIDREWGILAFASLDDDADDDVVEGGLFPTIASIETSSMRDLPLLYEGGILSPRMAFVQQV